MGKYIRVSLVRSTIGRPKQHRKILKSIGLTKLNQVVEFRDSPSVRGMVRKVSHLVVTEEKN